MTTKTKKNYVCQTCGSIFSKWMGQCGECAAWNSIVEEVTAVVTKPQLGGGYAGNSSVQGVQMLSEVELTEQTRAPSGLEELDRVLGGGIVAGSVVLLGGDPGIGKSTLLLQAATIICEQMTVLYVSGEESLQQISLRARRMDLPLASLELLAETCVERILQIAAERRPQILVIDSIQTIFTQQLQSAPGSVGQVRETAAGLVRFAKETATTVFLVGHVTKEGTLAGPRVLEHMVDCVLYFEGERDSRFRMIRAVKNRFGAVNELGIFAMTEKGLRQVNNPSALFLSRTTIPVPGSMITTSWEGSRPLLVEVQALVAPSHLGNPRRIAVGLDPNRLAMLLAVLHRHAGVATYDQDVFINAVGGVKLQEPAVDLALLLAVVSSFRNRPIAQDLVVFGEVGLAGEVRPVQSGLERLKEAAKHGFKRAIVPIANAPKKPLADIEVVGVTQVSEALQQ